MEEDAFALNIAGVEDLISSGINKTNEIDQEEEGVSGEEIDVLELPMTDRELLDLRDGYEEKHNGYYPKIKPRQDKNKVYYVGKQRNSTADTERVVSSNLIFEAEETFIPQALSSNPEPVVWSDNTDDGQNASNSVKTMLQYHADVLCLRRKLGVMVRHWSIYFVAGLKYGWDAKAKDVKVEVRKPQNFVFDPDGYVDEYGNFIGAFLGERIECSAEKLIELFPKHKDYVLIKVNNKLGTSVIRTEWWTDDYCFTTYLEVVLDKHKNEFFNYGSEDENGTATPGLNHFEVPKMPYTFLSVFSLQERPHDITSLIEQNIPNQDRINDRDDQVTRNLRTSNNSLVLSKKYGWNSENAAEGAQAIEDGEPILAPDEISSGIQRLPANALPSGVLESLQTDKDTLRSIFGTQGLSAQKPNEDTTARGMILNQSHDSSRIGGGIGDALEQVADNFFNWLVQLYCVFYDEAHYAAIMGSGQAVEYVSLINTDFARRFVVSVAPNSMQPKDEISEANQAIELAQSGLLDPISMFKKLSYPDPMETAGMATLFKVNPQLYLQTYFPQLLQPQQPQGQPGAPQAPQGGPPPSQTGSPPEPLSQEPASASLSNVPLPK